MDETYIKVKGQWKYLYRAVDSSGQTTDFLLTAKWDAAAAQSCFRKAIRHYGEPEVVTIDTTTGAIADQTLNSAKPEAISFSMLHKWNFMSPLGRQIQNWSMMAVVTLSIALLAGFGIRSRHR